MMTRREVVVGGALTMVFGVDGPRSACAQSARARRIYGCTLAADEVDRYYRRAAQARLYVTGKEALILGSGDTDFDFALAHTLARIADVLEALPGFAFYDDHDGLNAYATPTVRLANADGTVLFGQGLLKRLRSGKEVAESPEVSVAAVCAHEFGHILQYKRKLDKTVGAGQLTVKRIELQADFFAGYFAGVRKRERPNFPAAVFALTQYNSGDNMIDDPGHHGTAEERGAAISKGFEVAFRERRSLAEAIQASLSYVSRL